MDLSRAAFTMAHGASHARVCHLPACLCAVFYELKAVSAAEGRDSAYAAALRDKLAALQVGGLVHGSAEQV